MSLTKVSYSMITGASVNVLDYGAIPNGTTDCTSAIQAAIDSINVTNGGGIVYFPKGVYKTTATITVPWTGSGIILQGAGGPNQTSNEGTSVILGVHTGEAIVSLQGAVFCQINDMVLRGDATSTPQCGLLLGRNGPGSAGWHSFRNMGCRGSYSVAAMYNVASEGNSYSDCWFALDEDCDAEKCVYLSNGNNGGLTPVTPLTASTLLGADFYTCNFYNNTLTSGAACIYIDTSGSVGSLNFYGGYLILANGHFVRMTTGIIDGDDSFGPFTFTGMGAERPGGVGTEQSGFYFSSQAGADNTQIQGLAIIGCQFHMENGYFLRQDNFTVIANSVVLASSGKTLAGAYRPNLIGELVYGSTPVPAGGISNSMIDASGVGLAPPDFSTSLIPLTLTSPWTNTFSLANGYGAPACYKDVYNVVHLTGAIGNGSGASNMATLPIGCRPVYNQYFSIASNNGSVIVSIDATTGVIAFVSGSGFNPVYLTGVTFPASL